MYTVTDIKEQRHRAIAELIRSQPLASQDELAERLADQGFAVTQATISRDLEQLGAAKVRRDGRLGYALPPRYVETRSDAKLALLVTLAQQPNSHAHICRNRPPFVDKRGCSSHVKFIFRQYYGSVIP